VAIARELDHDPAVLIFDEPTSALDAESERVVKENMGLLLEGRRPSSSPTGSRRSATPMSSACSSRDGS
jgi:hypothetical protein